MLILVNGVGEGDGVCDGDDGDFDDAHDDDDDDTPDTPDTVTKYTAHWPQEFTCTRSGKSSPSLLSVGRNVHDRSHGSQRQQQRRR